MSEDGIDSLDRRLCEAEDEVTRLRAKNAGLRKLLKQSRQYVSHIKDIDSDGWVLPDNVSGFDALLDAIDKEVE